MRDRADERESVEGCESGEVLFTMFKVTAELVFSVLQNAFRRFLTSEIGAEYLWERIMTDKLKNGIILFQAYARKWSAKRRVVRIRAMMVRMMQLQSKLNVIYQEKIAAAIKIQKIFRGYSALRKTEDALQMLKKIKLLEQLQMWEERVFSVMTVQKAWRFSVERWPDTCMVRQRVRERIIKRWDARRGNFYYWDTETQLRSEAKPLLMRNEDCDFRLVCATCNAKAVERSCLQCQKLECSDCFCKKHGPDTLVDDLEAAKLLGTASFGHEIPLHRHGWLEITPKAEICGKCRESLAISMCRECNCAVCSSCCEHESTLPINFRARYREKMT